MNLIDILKRREYNYKHFEDVLNRYEEGSVIKPTGEDYNLFNQLFELNLVIKQTVPIWKNGALIGSEITFAYQMDLDYSYLLFLQ